MAALEKVNNKRKYKIAQFNQNDSRKLKFLTDVTECPEFIFHKNFDLGVDDLCEKHRGKDKEECKYCKEEVTRRQRYGFYVYDYDERNVQVIITLASDYSVLPAIVGLARDNGETELGITVKNQTVLLDRTGYGMKTEFHLMPLKDLEENVENIGNVEDLNYENMLASVVDFWDKNVLASNNKSSNKPKRR